MIHLLVIHYHHHRRHHHSITIIVIVVVAVQLEVQDIIDHTTNQSQILNQHKKQDTQTNNNPRK